MTPGTPLPDFLRVSDPDPQGPPPPGYEAQRGSGPLPPGSLESEIGTPPTQGTPHPGGHFLPPHRGDPETEGSGENGLLKNGPQDFLADNRILEVANTVANIRAALAVPSPKPLPLPGNMVIAPRAEDDEYYRHLEPRLQTFLRVLEKAGMVTRAAEVSGVARGLLYRMRSDDKDFKRLWEQALRYRGEMLEDEALRRAVHGVDEPVFYMGAVCGHKRTYSDMLLSKLLEGAMPEKYRQNHKVEVEGVLGVATLVLPAATTAEEWAKQNSGAIIDQLPESEYD